MNYSNVTEILKAIKKKDISKVKLILKEDIDVNQYGKNFTDTPLNYAITYEDAEIVKVLLEFGARVECFVWINFAGLLQDSNYKFSDSRREILSLIINAGIEIDCPLESGRTLLMEAAADGAIDTVKFLVESGADVNAISQKQHYALLSAACAGHKKVYEYLAPLTLPELRIEAEKELPKGLIFRKRKENKLLNSFMDAASSGNLESLQNLLKKGVNVNTFNVNGDTALCIAAIVGDVKVTRALIRAGADINLGSEEEGQTPLIYATGFVAQAKHYNEEREQEYIEVIQLLINAGANVNISDKEGYTPLILAAYSQSIKAVNQLIQAGADVNAKTNDGWTALSAAANVGNIETIELLLKSGVFLNVKDNYGKNALNYALEEGHKKVVRLLRESGVKEN